MAKIDTAGQYESLRKEIESGNFKPVYILMGEEPFYPERLCSLIMERALQPHERDFNQTVLYGADTSAEEIVSVCGRYPMMAERTLVVVREAQALKKPEGLGVYLDHISPTTVLVLLFSGKNMDKRTSFYKKAAKSCVIFESVKVREEAMPRWIESWFRSIGRSIEPQGAMLLAEYAGNDLRKISVESDKLLKAVPESQKTITAADIEQNVGISREFNTGELTSALAVRDGDKAFRIAWFFGESPRQYPLQMTLGFLFFFFSKVEMIHAIMLRDRISAKDALPKPESTTVTQAPTCPLSAVTVSAGPCASYPGSASATGEAKAIPEAMLPRGNFSPNSSARFFLPEDRHIFLHLTSLQ